MAESVTDSERDVATIELGEDALLEDQEKIAYALEDAGYEVSEPVEDNETFKIRSEGQ